MVDGATDLLLQVELNTISTILHLPMALLVAYLSFIGQEKRHMRSYSYPIYLIHVLGGVLQMNVNWSPLAKK